MFPPGVGVVDGEIIKTLWEPLYHIAPSTQKASFEHHQEIIDDHMNNSNWKKILHMGVYVHVLYIFCNLIFSVVGWLCPKYSTTIIEEHNSVAVLKSIRASSDKDLVEEWKEQEAFAQVRQNLDPSAMDIYDLKVSNGNYIYMSKYHSTDNSEAPSKVDVELMVESKGSTRSLEGRG